MEVGTASRPIDDDRVAESCPTRPRKPRPSRQGPDPHTDRVGRDHSNRNFFAPIQSMTAA